MTSTSTIKAIVIAFDLICSLIALVLIAFGIYVICSYETNDVGATASFAYIGIGVATLIIFLLGCIAVLRDSVCCTITFSVLLFIVIIVQLLTVVLLTKYETAVASNLSNTLDDAWEEELKNPGAMTIYEDWFKCCGRASPQDYIVNERLPPETCFQNHDKSVSENLIQTGCRVEFENYLMKLLHIFNILAAVMIIFEIIASILNCCLCNQIRNDNRRARY